MKESAKTLLLAVLVAASLVQSYLLAYSEPKFDTIIPTDYVESKLEGSQAELSELLFPKDIVLHFGSGEHTVLYPKMIFYRMILEVVEQRTFDGLRLANNATDIPDRGDAEMEGIEIRFAEDIELPVLQQMMNLKLDSAMESTEPIDRILIYTYTEREEVRVFFTGSRSGTGYEATRADLTVKDIERFVGFGETRTRYAAVDRGHYLPVEPIPMVQYRYRYRQWAADQLQRSLFPDPFSIRNLTERDGSEIFTDGKRGLQLSDERQWLSYTDPAAPAAGEQTSLETALSAVQFVNRHGGWNGDYALERIAGEPGNAERTALFRQYIGSYPGSYPVIGGILGQDGSAPPFGRIETVLRNRVVTRYERSTLQLEGSATDRTSVTLPGGASLLQLWEQYDDKALVRDIFPAYRVVIHEQEMTLEPVWGLSMLNGTVRALPGGGAY
ncbi:two-component system activity regulator YycH [Paenibacillus sp. TRM 82003]|nr:two-component system activity regulator YycH [Paenibacillus sp. TRM 82003]